MTDLLGRPTQIRLADGKTTTLSYDLTGSSYNAPGAPDASKGYLSQVTDRSGSTSYQRDIFGRVVQKTQALPNSSTQQVTYSFTASGQAGTTTYPSGNQLANAYNSAGQLTTLPTPNGPMPTPNGPMPSAAVISRVVQKPWTLRNSSTQQVT